MPSSRLPRRGRQRASLWSSHSLFRSASFSSCNLATRLARYSFASSFASWDICLPLGIRMVLSTTNERATSIIAHQIIIPRASSFVRNSVVISLNPIQSPSQLIVGAPFVAENSHRRTESVETTLLSSSRQRSSGGELQLQITELHADVASSPPDVYHLYLPLLGSADGKRSGVAKMQSGLRPSDLITRI